jgi:hypothetical protein
MPSQVPFCSLQVLLLLQHSNRLNPPVKLLGGGGGSPVEALQLHSNTQSHWSSGSTICFPLRAVSLWVFLQSWASYFQKVSSCGEPAISHDSHHVSLVQWTNLFASCHKGHRFKSPGGTYVKPGFSC